MTLIEDVRTLQNKLEGQQREIDSLRNRLIVAELAVDEIKNLRRVMYWVGGLIVAGSIGFGFSVLALIPN